ncbi:MAG: ankyrin repeat domain-containing protein [Desulfovibrionaceae bacterium]|nr:ankyrin repeat domain-containing protein [Desulfovibrionaceae bacterium]
MQPERKKGLLYIAALALAVFCGVAGYYHFFTGQFVFAAEKLDEGAMKRFLFFGMDPNGRDRQGRAALTVSAWHDYVRPVKLLLEHGADPDIRDDGGWTPLMIAASTIYRDEIEQLIRYKGNVGSMSGRMYLIDSGPRTYVMEALLEGGAKADAETPEGFTALAMACYTGRTKAVEVLLKHGADPNHRDSFGNRAWQYNCRRHAYDDIRALFAKYGYR